MVSRTGQRLAWRFLNIPRRKYQCWYALSADGAPVALAIGRKMEVAGIQCAMLADLLFAKGHESQAKALVRKVLDVLREEGADMAGCLMLPWTAEAALLRKLGFFKCPKAMEPQPFLFCAHCFQEEIRETGTHVLEHVPDMDAAVSELLRVTKKRLLIVLPRQREYRYTADLHIRFFPYEYNVRAALPVSARNARIFMVGSDWGILIDRETS